MKDKVWIRTSWDGPLEEPYFYLYEARSLNLKVLEDRALWEEYRKACKQTYELRQKIENSFRDPTQEEREAFRAQAAELEEKMGLASLVDD